MPNMLRPRRPVKGLGLSLKEAPLPTHVSPSTQQEGASPKLSRPSVNMPSGQVHFDVLVPTVPLAGQPPSGLTAISAMPEPLGTKHVIERASTAGTGSPD